MKVLPQHRPDKQDGKAVTYSQLLDDWLRSSRLNIKESTYARYAHLIERHIKPHLGDLPLSQLTTQIVEDFIATQLESGRLDGHGGLAPKTVTDILAVIKNTMEYARYNNYEIICNLKKLSVKKKEKEMRVLSPTE